MYTDDKNAQVVLALLKKYGIRKIVISPGTTNVPIARSVEQDDFFEIYSMVDERGAAYFAGGLAFASGEPVVISCTGATASRNYMPGLTEAYYRNLPVIALTSGHHTVDFSDLYPQVIDRTASQNDIKRFSAVLPFVKDKEDMKKCVFLVNKALLKATTKGCGPVHIDLAVSPRYSFTTRELPDVQKIDYYNCETMDNHSLAKELSGKRIAILIGSHKPFTPDEIDSISEFARRYNAPVFYDHTSSYTGDNRILISVASDLRQTKQIPDILIDLGSVIGDYSASRLFKDVETWRISDDGELHNRMGVESLAKVFEMSEKHFFDQMNRARHVPTEKYYQDLEAVNGPLNIPTLPLSNTFISSKLSQAIPHGSVLHMGILNSLRNMDFFELDPSITTSCNVGGFGIDGALSTSIGQSMANHDRLTFCLLGDLAFFYDMNSLGNRHITKNLRVLMINNGEGVEFRLNNILESQWGSCTDDHIAAIGHFGSGKQWAESMGFIYMHAETKEQFEDQLSAFTNPDISSFNGPVLFEVFTKVIDEQQALRSLRNANRPIKTELPATIGAHLIKYAPKPVKRSISKIAREK